MNRKDLLKDIGYKLKKIREALNYSSPDMASRFGVVRSSYLRNESGQTCPDIQTMRILGTAFDVSLDWLICDKGPMYYREKEPSRTQPEKPVEKIVDPQVPQTGLQTGLETKPSLEIPDTVPEDIRELLEHMKRIPLLRYQILAAFHKFKAEYKDMVSTAMVQV